MFTKEEATCLLEERWGLQNVRQRLQQDRHGLLDDIVVTVQAKVPFQNLTLMATPPAQRRRPMEEDIKRDCLSGYGGLCYTLNVFTFNLLKALCYDAALCHATCTSTVGFPDNHVFVLVQNLRNRGDRYLVEAGVGFPTYRAVPLDFTDESPTYVDSFLEYKYIKHENLLLRMHRRGDTAPRPHPPRPDIDFYIGEWRRFYFSDMKPHLSVSEFDECFDTVYTNPKASNFHNAPRALMFPDKLACILSSNRMTLEKDDGEVVRQVFPDDEDDDVIVRRYQDHFPQISGDIVLRAYQEWRRVKSGC
ncbi:hypothetical protein BaRGS_00004370 [Batillaria attramentaria]|uniref:arylamine N-acetyltransferase n=1 Tax=Batillaria attramentaria TaxID=370345 RepID=A0ABD0LZP7_9CAEN